MRADHLITHLKEITLRRLEHPYHDLSGTRTVRGNLHTHTNRSDGRRTPQEVIDDYAGRGYDFLMLSDHDLFTNPVEFDSRGMVMLNGNEITANGPHLLHVDTKRVVEPHRQRQRVLNDVASAGDGFVIVNHPNWQAAFDHCAVGQMREWDAYVGLEIYNGTIGRLDGSPYATNKWDMLLASGRRLWGFANDDSHLPREDVGLGWNTAFVRERTGAAILNALRSGRFYASTGVTINEVRVDGTRIRVETADAERIVALHQVGKRFAQVDGNAIEVDVPDAATYVRFECWGRGERFAWTQPFFVVNE